MAESVKVAELRIPRNLLIRALEHISNITNQAAVDLIVNRERRNEKIGISFSNIAKIGDFKRQFDVYAAYPIFNYEMIYCTFIVGEWPVIYIACTAPFIKSVGILPPIMTSEGLEALDIIFWNIKDGDALKSETIIFGDHHSYIASIIQYSEEADGEGRTVSANESDIDISYV